MSGVKQPSSMRSAPLAREQPWVEPQPRWGRHGASDPCVEEKESALNMPHNPKIAFYRERFNLALVDYDPQFAARSLPEEPQADYRLSAIRNAIADLRGDLQQINQIIRVLEWLSANPPPGKS
jgi:hypothetical protein